MRQVVAVMFLLPIVALALLRDDRGSAPFALTAVGLVVVALGVVVVSNAVKTPDYRGSLAPLGHREAPAQ